MPSTLGVVRLFQSGYIYHYALVMLVGVFALMSWFVRDPRNPLYGLLYRLTSPVLRPAQRLLPLVGGVDLSPLLAVVVLQLGAILVIAPLRDLALALH